MTGNLDCVSTSKHNGRKRIPKIRHYVNVRGMINQYMNCTQDVTAAVGQKKTARLESVESPAINFSSLASVSQW